MNGKCVLCDLCVPRNGPWLCWTSTWMSEKAAPRVSRWERGLSVRTHRYLQTCSPTRTLGRGRLPVGSADVQMSGKDVLPQK